ncbi:AI-2E family transporter [Alpinimonas psychrophila]|uniref:Putative PurR-regulated permease PerM n=1 Tax=Alpinimonas psychrophila TaxID=748908 RepID=A0A7W3PMN9_9MICO|nr:putative PurR-regulated permease PerM [Alpinimonas psychrophila]
MTATHEHAHFSRPARILITVAAASIAIWGIHSARDVIGPLVLAAVLTIVAHPLRYRLERWGWPRWLATAVVVLAVYVALAIFATLLAFAVTQFAQQLPDYADRLTAVSDQLIGWMTSAGIVPTGTESLISGFNTDQLVAVGLSVANSFFDSSVGLILVVAYVIFMAADAAFVPALIAELAERRPRLADSFNAYAVGVRRYVVVNTIFGIFIAVLDGIILVALGIPGPLTWAVLAFITNYIPNIGFVIGVIPPAIIALLIGGWPLAILVIVLYAAANMIQTLVQPIFVGVHVGIGFTLTFVSVIVWAAILGPLGALLAVPMTLLGRMVLIDSDPNGDWAARLTGNLMQKRKPKGSTRDSEG